MINSFKDLKVWKVADELFFMIIEDIPKFPKNFIGNCLSNQVVRSISSISANIAEGSGRGSGKEFHRFLIIARGSISESQNWIYKIHQLEWINRKRFLEYMDKFQLNRKLINGLISKLRKSFK